MSIATVSYITLNDTDKIGLSDTLDNYTIDAIKASGYVGCYDPLRTNCYTADRVTLWTGIEEYNTPFSAELVGYPYPKSHNLDEGTGTYTGPVFSAVVWLQRINDGLPSPVITASNIEDYKLVTEMPANKMYYTVPGLNNWNSSLCASSWSSEMTFPCCYYAPGYGDLDYHSNYGAVDDISASAGHIYPYMMYEFEGYFYFQLITQQYDYYSFWATNSDQTEYINTIPFGSSSMVPYTEDQYISLGTAYNVDITSLDYSSLASITFSPSRNIGGVWAGPANDPAFYDAGYHPNDNNKYLVVWSVGGSGINYDVIRFFTCIGSKSDSLLFFANSGVKIIADTVYKPIIENGVVTGITDNMTDESELDDWSMGGTDHGITPVGPPPPPAPGADDDNKDPVNLTGAPFADGIAHYYAMTAGSVLLSHVSEALGTWDIDSSKKDLYRNLISCKLVKPPAPIPVSGSEDFTIYGVVPQYQGAGVKLPVINGNPTASFGPYTISRKFGDFRDFAPYTKAEIYLPYCGWCALPSHVVGRKLTVHYYTDIIAATCKAVVLCGQNIIAEAAGVIGLDIPFAAENVGAKMEAVNAALLATASGGVQLAAGVGSMVSTKSSAGLKGAASGLSQYISGYTQMAMAFNENWTEISGKNGDGCALAGATNIIIKITRPKFGPYTTPPYVPAGYAHNVGYVSNKEITLGSAQGLVICDNADTSGISGATDAERAEIKRVLETGIYVNSPPE